MISAAARNRRMSASPFVRPPLFTGLGFAAEALANSPAPMVPAPTASDFPKKERRLRKPLDGLALSAAPARISVAGNLLISDSRSAVPPRSPFDVALSA